MILKETSNILTYSGPWLQNPKNVSCWFQSKVHIFCEGRKILRNLHLTFDYSKYSQKLGEDFAKFCGLLRIHIWTLTFFEIFSFQKFVISCKKMTMNGAISWDMVNPEEIIWFRICPKAKILLNSQNHHSNQFANYF